MGSHNRGREVQPAALCPAVSAMATLGNRSGSPQDGTICIPANSHALGVSLTPAG